MSKTLPYIIGIAGGSASGKTTFINRLREQFNTNELCVISQDNYYKSLSDQQVDANGEVNFDLPEAIDFKRLIRDVKTLAKGQEVRMIEYTFNNPGAFPKELVFKSAPILIIEGLFIYAEDKLSRLFDLKVFIEARPDIMFKRRMKRDLNERGIPEEMIRYQWNEHFMPAYEEHMMPHRDSVDMIVVNNSHFDHSFKVFSDHCVQVLSTASARKSL
ncbi:MAG: uridine kinase [Flavobacteriales bacterium]|nr:uridine kinase [Bacteroidota bacterium]MCB9241177.1 uridine kinase [Flavobacteriales bacterium]